eukprot:9502642-Alexandrium_andersonii.AAC.1
MLACVGVGSRVVVRVLAVLYRWRVRDMSGALAADNASAVLLGQTLLLLLGVNVGVCIGIASSAIKSVCVCVRVRARCCRQCCCSGQPLLVFQPWRS